MKKVPFLKAEFVLSALKEEDFPIFHTGRGPSFEIAFVGRSNVGKSSLINHLLKNKSLAKVSATPGKTQCINFFRIDNVLTLVDLPGYGYAKVSHALRHEWSGAIETYLQKRPSLILLLLDLRHGITSEDISLVQWALELKKEILFIFTKTDKLKPQEVESNTQLLLNSLESIPGMNDLSYMRYSIKDSAARSVLVDKINVHLEGMCHGIYQ